MKKNNWSCMEIQLKYDQIVASTINCRNTCNAYEVIKASINMDEVAMQEHFWAIYLSRNNDVIGFRTISIGTINTVIVDANLILATALLLGSKSLILVHNHPSGNLNPSQKDVDFTENMIKAAGLLDIKIEDHLIITQHNYLSMMGEGFVDFSKYDNYGGYSIERQFLIDNEGFLARAIRRRGQKQKVA